MRQFNALLNQPELKGLAAHSKETQAAQKIWSSIAPGNLGQLSHASSIKNQQLILYASNNAVAAKIKLCIPSLLIQLENQGCEVTAIRVKVQVKSSPQAQPKAIKKLSRQAANELDGLAKKLSGTDLGDALARLASKVN